MLVTNDSSRHAWVYRLKQNSNADGFRNCLADACTDGVPSMLMFFPSSDSGGEFFAGEFGEVRK